MTSYHKNKFDRFKKKKKRLTIGLKGYYIYVFTFVYTYSAISLLLNGLFLH